MSDSGTPAPRVRMSRSRIARQAVEGRQGGPRHRRGEALTEKIILVTLATVVVIIIAAVGGDYWYINHLINHVNVGSETKQTYHNTENILLVGSTTRLVSRYRTRRTDSVPRA